MAADAPPVRPGALANFLRVGIRPRETMRGILDAGRDRMVVPLVFLAMVSFTLGDTDRPSLASFGSLPGYKLALAIVGILLGALIFGLLFFYLFSWAVVAIGRVMEGQGRAREVRSAMAWGVVPAIWALVYRIPAVIWFSAVPPEVRSGNSRITFNAPMASQGCVVMVVFGILELSMLIWLLWVQSNTIGEAHRFSAWRGLATILLTAVTPIIITIAAVLAI